MASVGLRRWKKIAAGLLAASCLPVAASVVAAPPVARAGSCPYAELIFARGRYRTLLGEEPGPTGK